MNKIKTLNKDENFKNIIGFSSNKSDKYDFVLNGTFNSKNVTNVYYIAPNPPNYLTSFSGSGLPYPNIEIAYQNTPNKGNIIIDKNGRFQIKLLFPNAYYTEFGNYYNTPYVNIYYTINNNKKLLKIKLDEGIPYRSLTYPYSRTSAMFYNKNLPIRSQEKIIKDSQFPINNVFTMNDFWKLKPPL